jgi:hypothetical protein
MRAHAVALVIVLARLLGGELEAAEGALEDGSGLHVDSVMRVRFVVLSFCRYLLRSRGGRGRKELKIGGIG